VAEPMGQPLPRDAQLDQEVSAAEAPFTSSPPNSIDLAHIGSVIFAAGFRPDYRSWLPWPDAFDTWGFPLTQDGASTVVPGLYFVGVHFLRKRKSSLLIGVGEDAAIVVRQITKAYSVSR
jgi:putative flavoprotein involved in K+ transport